MNYSFRTLLLAALLAIGSMADAQLPNEKFGKPSNMEWEFVGWGNATQADAIILCKTMTVTYQLSDQVVNNNQSYYDVSHENIQDFGINQIDDSNILVKYEFRLRTKILKPEGAKHANIDITYYDAANEKKIVRDELTDLKIKVFTKNEKGKVVKRSINTTGFAKERVNDDYMVMHVVVPDVEAGSIIEYQYDITSSRPAFIYDWLFQECIPTVRSKADIEIPAFLQFKMNVPTNKLVKSSVEAGHLTYDTNRIDMKKGRSCLTNHYKMVGDYIPEGEEIAPFTSQIITRGVTPPATIPQGHSHLKLK